MFWNADPRTSPRFSSSLMNINGSDESDDDSIADKNYLPSNTSSCSDESENDSSKVSQGCKNNASLSKSANSSVNISGVLNISDKAACGARDNTDLTVQTSDEKKSNTIRNTCVCTAKKCTVNFRATLNMFIGTRLM